jgi:hypothetical protein
MINQLTIVHCKLDSAIKLDDHLVKIRSVAPYFAPETCSRQIYIFMGLSLEQRQQLHELCDGLKDACKCIEVLDSYDAYELLLQWSVGVLSHKNGHNDHFVLGRLREFWTLYTYTAKGQPLLTKLMTIIPKLLEHSGIVRHYIQTKLEKVYASVRIEQTKKYCANIRSAMENPGQVLIEPSCTNIRDLQRHRLVQLKRGIASLQEDVPAQTIKQHPEPDDKVSIAQLKKFSVALQKIQEKRMLESKLESLNLTV